MCHSVSCIFLLLLLDENLWIQGFLKYVTECFYMRCTYLCFSNRSKYFFHHFFFATANEPVQALCSQSNCNEGNPYYSSEIIKPLRALSSEQDLRLDAHQKKRNWSGYIHLLFIVCQMCEDNLEPALLFTAERILTKATLRHISHVSGLTKSVLLAWNGF